MEIAGKKAVIVGGASGMARASAKRLHERGASVAILDLPKSAGAEAAKELDGSFHPVDITDALRHPISVVGTHMSHLHMGSHRNWAELRRQLRTEARPDAVLAGDMNTWGPLVHLFMPGWSRAVIGRTWPTWNPHSQIDHILVRGSLRIDSGAVLAAAGSDHRPVRAELILR